MTMIIDGTNGLTFNNSTVQASAGAVLQVQSTYLNTTFSTTSTGYVNVTGLAVTITPKFSNSKIWIMFHLNVAPSDLCGVQVLRGSTAIGNGATGQSNQNVGMLGGVPSPSNNDKVFPLAGNYLDSPATTSATTYQIQMNGNSQPNYVNRTVNDANASYAFRTSSVITVMEVAA